MCVIPKRGKLGNFPDLQTILLGEKRANVLDSTHPNAISRDIIGSRSAKISTDVSAKARREGRER
jgi:hypothetical protein